MVSTRFLEANGVYDSPKPKPQVSNHFLEINGVYGGSSKPQTANPVPPTVEVLRGAAPILQSVANTVENPVANAPGPMVILAQASPPETTWTPSNRFLEINDALPVAQPQPVPSAVDVAAMELSEAIDAQNAVDPFARRFFQGHVDDARDTLEAAVRDEIEVAQPFGPHAGQGTFDAQVEAGDRLITRYAHDAVLFGELQRVVGNVIVDIEVEDAVAYVAGAEHPDDAFDRLANRIDLVSVAAQHRLLQDETVGAVLDDVVTDAMYPLDHVQTDNRPWLRFYDATERLEGLVDRADNPDLAADIVLRAQPAFEQVLAEFNADGINNFQPLIDGAALQKLGQISDALVGARGENRALSVLADIAITGTAGSVYSSVIPFTGDGTGLPLALEIVRQMEADPAADAGPVLDQIIGNYERYIEGPVADAIDAYSEHAEELNFYIASFPEDLPPELLQDAIEEYVENKGSDWQAEYERLFADVSAHGVRLLQQREMIDEVVHLNEDGQEKLADAANHETFAIAVEVAAQNAPMALARVDIDINAAIQFIDGLDFADRAANLRRGLANAHVQGKLTEVVSDIDFDVPSTVTAARAAIQEMATEQFAAAWGVDVDELVVATEGIEELLNRQGPIAPDEIEQAFARVEATLEQTSAFAADKPLGFTFRSIGLAVSVQSAVGSTRALFEDPSLGNAVQAAVDDIAFLQVTTEFATDLGLVARDSALATRFGSSATVGKLLGVAGIAIGTVGVANELQEGDYLQAGFGAVGIGGSAFALFGSGSLAGPIGIGIAALATAGSLGLDHIRNVAESNKYTEEPASDFFAHAGFDEDAANALADRSGEGHSPIGILIAYGDAHGLSTEETIDWINSLDKSDLDWVRDRFHHTLDDIDGDLSQFSATHEDDHSKIRGYERTASRNGTVNHAPISAVTADWLIENRNIALPT